jgi:hypothetical protein
MSRLSEKLRKQREVKVKVGKWTFIALRPTDVEAIEVHRAGSDFSTIAARFVIGWQGVTEDDLVGGGVKDEVAFDKETWDEWCANRSDFWTPISEAILAAYTTHREDMETAPKN